MSGVRVYAIPNKCDERHLKIHFSEPENGGGPIQDIYFPMFEDSAVIIFKNDRTAVTVLAHERENEHAIMDQVLDVQRIPSLQVFPKLTAEIDPSVASFLQATGDVRDEIEYNGGLKYCTDAQKNIIGVRGNWYQLEWAWNKIESFMQHQSYIQQHVVRSNMVRQRSKDQQSANRDDVNRINRQHSNGQTVAVSSFDAARSMAPTPMSHPDVRSPVSRIPLGEEGSSPTGVSPSNSSFTKYRDRKGFHSDWGEDDLGPVIHIPKMKMDTKKGKPMKKKELYVSIFEGKRAQNQQATVESDSDNNLDATGVDSKRQVEVRAAFKGPEIPVKEFGVPDVERRRQTGSKTVINIINDNPHEMRCIDFQLGPLTVSVYTGWITMEETDAIVSDAMGSVINGGGVTQSIATAASPQMQRQCDEYVKTSGGHLLTSQVMHTCAGGSISSKVKHVIHAVGPMWSDDEQRSNRCMIDLTSTFLNVFKYGNNVLKITSIAVPLISSGIFGCPLEVCVRSFLNAVLLYPTSGSGSASDTSHLREVHLVNNDEQNTALTVLALRDHFKDGTNVLLAEAQRTCELQYAPAVSLRSMPLQKSAGQNLMMDTNVKKTGSTSVDRPDDKLRSTTFDSRSSGKAKCPPTSSYSSMVGADRPPAGSSKGTQHLPPTGKNLPQTNVDISTVPGTVGSIGSMRRLTDVPGTVGGMETMRRLTDGRPLPPTSTTPTVSTTMKKKW